MYVGVWIGKRWSSQMIKRSGHNEEVHNDNMHSIIQGILLPLRVTAMRKSSGTPPQTSVPNTCSSRVVSSLGRPFILK